MRWRRKIVSNSEMKEKNPHTHPHTEKQTHFIYMRRCELWASRCAHVCPSRVCLSTKLLKTIIPKHFQQFPFHIVAVMLQRWKNYLRHMKNAQVNVWCAVRVWFVFSLRFVYFVQWITNNKRCFGMIVLRTSFFFVFFFSIANSGRWRYRCRFTWIWLQYIWLCKWIADTMEMFDGLLW